MEVIYQMGEFSKKEIFNLTMGGGTLLKNVATGTIITVGRAIIINDTVKSKSGEEEKVKSILHIMDDKNGLIYTTESPTVIDTFKRAMDFLGRDDGVISFALTRKQSKGGRTFMDLFLCD